MNSTTVETPDAELLIATGCAHCGSELEALTRLLKEGLIGELRISNIVPRPQRAEELGVRSVPWLRLGPFVLEGQHSETELRHWAERANHIDGMSEYIREELKQGHLDKLIDLLGRAPEYLPALIPLLEDSETEMQVRIGIDAILESLDDKRKLRSLVADFSRLASHPDPRIRADAGYYLSLTGSSEAIPALQKQLADESEDIREIAREGLQKLEAVEA